MEEIELYLDDTSDMMSKSITHLIDALSKIRAGKAMPTMLSGVMVDYYGNMTPLNQVASVSSPDARTLMIKPWEKTMIQEIEKAIMNSDLGFNPQNDGEQVIINIPALTEERRIQLVKLAKNEGEHAKISIRNARKDTNDGLKLLKNDGISEDEIKRAEDTVQKLTDEYTHKVDEFIIHKEKDIMTV